MEHCLPSPPKSCKKNNPIASESAGVYLTSSKRWKTLSDLRHLTPVSPSASPPPPVLWYINNSLLTQPLYRSPLQHSDLGLLCTTRCFWWLLELLLLQLQHDSWVGGWSDAPRSLNSLPRSKLGAYRRCGGTVYGRISLTAAGDVNAK